MQGPLPKCSTPGCRLWVWSEAPKKIHWVDGMAMIEQIGPSVPKSDKCWFHAHSEQPPPGTE